MPNIQEIVTEEKTYTIVLANVTGDCRRKHLLEAGFERDLLGKFIKKSASRREVLEYHELVQSTWRKVGMRFITNG